MKPGSRIVTGAGAALVVVDYAVVMTTVACASFVKLLNVTASCKGIYSF